jgi:hypothetical protein
MGESSNFWAENGVVKDVCAGLRAGDAGEGEIKA